jgi:hypothetical protein
LKNMRRHDVRRQPDRQARPPRSRARRRRRIPRLKAWRRGSRRGRIGLGAAQAGDAVGGRRRAW